MTRPFTVAATLLETACLHPHAHTTSRMLERTGTIRGIRWMTPFYRLGARKRTCYNPRMVRCLAAAIVFASVLSSAEPVKNDFRFSILGDRTGDAQPGVYERIWNEMDAFHPDFVINVGDTIQGGNDGTAASEWRALRRFGIAIRFASPPAIMTSGRP